MADSCNKNWVLTLFLLIFIMIEAAPLNYPLIWGITIAIMIGVVFVIATLAKIIWKLPYKITLSHHVGCLWAIILFLGGAFVYGAVKRHYTPKTVEIIEIDRIGNLKTKHYIDYFESPNGQKVTYEDQKTSKGYYIYNNSSSIIEEVQHFYGENNYSLPNEFVSRTIYPGDLIDLVIKPDFIFTEAPNSVTITTRHKKDIKSVSRSQLRFAREH